MSRKQSTEMIELYVLQNKFPQFLYKHKTSLMVNCLYNAANSILGHSPPVISDFQKFIVTHLSSVSQCVRPMITGDGF